METTEGKFISSNRLFALLTISHDEEDLYDTMLKHINDDNIKYRDVDNYTFLHLAAGFGHFKVCQLLIDKGADIDAVSTHNYTPLFTACLNGSRECVRILLNAGADINIGSNLSNRTPLEAAASFTDHNEIILMIIEHQQTRIETKPAGKKK